MQHPRVVSLALSFVVTCACSNEVLPTDPNGESASGGGNAAITGGTGGVGTGGSLDGPTGGTLNPVDPNMYEADGRCAGDIFTVTGYVICGIGCSSSLGVQFETASSHTYKVVQLANGWCDGPGEGGAGGEGGASAELDPTNTLQVWVDEFEQGAGQISGEFFRVDVAPAVVTVVPHESDGYVTYDGSVDMYGDPMAAGYLALIDLDTGAVVRIVRFSASFETLAI